MESVMILVKVGEELPKIGGKITTFSPLTDTLYEITVKKITGLRWNKKGELIVEVSGNKKKVTS